MSPWLLLGGGWAAMAIVMAVMWIVQWRTRNAGIVDVAWAAGVGLLGVIFAAFGDGDPSRRLIVALLAGLWGLRLTVHLARRVAREPEDGRYQDLRERFADNAPAWFFGFFQVQALWAVMFATPMLIAANNPLPAPGVFDWLAIAIWLVAIGGESLADRQLKRFKADPANRGHVCQQGLWRYSRHPNYFFEWLHWFAYVCLGILGPYGWITLLGPAVMVFFLLKVTGIPPTEARAIATRGDEYREYQRSTNAFFPGPRKRVQ
ncbi:MAG TPA: DUF1295 domain-containing protein [Gammaproteobacteria bacterium]